MPVVLDMETAVDLINFTREVRVSDVGFLDHTLQIYGLLQGSIQKRYACSILPDMELQDRDIIFLRLCIYRGTYSHI